jgi:hypothetical protein
MKNPAGRSPKKLPSSFTNSELALASEAGGKHQRPFLSHAIKARNRIFQYFVFQCPACFPSNLFTLRAIALFTKLAIKQGRRRVFYFGKHPK